MILEIVRFGIIQKWVSDITYPILNYGPKPAILELSVWEIGWLIVLVRQLFEK